MFVLLRRDQDLTHSEFEFLRAMCANLSIRPYHFGRNLFAALQRSWGIDRGEDIPYIVQDYLFQEVECMCWLELGTDSVVAAVTHIFRHLDVAVTCESIHDVLQYHVMTQTYPDLEQLEYLQANLHSVRTDLDTYCDDHKVDVPMPGLELLAAVPATATTTCSICAETISVGTDLLRLPVCGHEFHAHEADCLGTGTVLNWLRTSKYCPNCRRENFIYT